MFSRLVVAQALRKLERKNRELREENEILKKAAAYVCHDGMK